MHVFVGERMTMLRDEHTDGQHERQTDRARAADVPACDLRPNVGLFSSISGHINSRFSKQKICRPAIHVVDRKFYQLRGRQ